MRVRPAIRRAGLAAAILSLATASPAAAGGFKLGVAAGEVTRTSAVLWTRADQSGPLSLEVTLGTNGFFEVLQAKPANDNTVRTRVTGLPPGKTFHYFFAQGGKRSAVGTFETAPSANAPKTIRFAFSGDADAQHGKGQSNIFYDSLAGNNGFTAQSFGIYHQMAAEKNDFNVNLGDTIYSDTEVPGGFPIARTLAAKRAKYRQNLAVANLRALRRSTGVYSQWDDHEFINDFTRAENSPVFKVGVQAFREYMPVHYTSTGGLYNTERWGRNLQLFRLDERSFRSEEASAKHTCDNPQTHKPDVAPTLPQSNRNTFAPVIPSFSQPVSQACKDKINDPKRTMLGKAQFHRFINDIERSNATFKVVLNEVPIQQFYALPYDGWEGYAHERLVLLHRLQNDGVKNVVFLTTDSHANMINVVRYRTLESGGPKDSPYKELVTGPVSTMTFEREIDRATGKSGNGNLVDAAFFSPPPPNGVGMPCSNLNVYSYGEVKVTPTALKVTAKDVNGNVVVDQSDGTTPCVLTIPKQ